MIQIISLYNNWDDNGDEDSDDEGNDDEDDGVDDSNNKDSNNNNSTTKESSNTNKSVDDDVDDSNDKDSNGSNSTTKVKKIVGDNINDIGKDKNLLMMLTDLKQGLTSMKAMDVVDGTVVASPTSTGTIENETNDTVAVMISELNNAINNGTIDATSGADLFVKCYNKYKYKKQQERFALLNNNDDNDEDERQKLMHYKQNEFVTRRLWQQK